MSAPRINLEKIEQIVRARGRLDLLLEFDRLLDLSPADRARAMQAAVVRMAQPAPARDASN